MFFINPRQKPSPKKKHEVLIDDLIASLAAAVREIGQNPMDISWDDMFFEINTNMSL